MSVLRWLREMWWFVLLLAVLMGGAYLLFRMMTAPRQESPREPIKALAPVTLIADTGNCALYRTTDDRGLTFYFVSGTWAYRGCGGLLLVAGDAGAPVSVGQGPR